METKGFFQFEIIQTTESDVYRRNILTSKVYHRAVRVQAYVIPTYKWDELKI